MFYHIELIAMNRLIPTFPNERLFKHIYFQTHFSIQFLKFYNQEKIMKLLMFPENILTLPNMTKELGQ